MRLVRYSRPEVWGESPFEQLLSLGDQINRLFNSPFGDLARGGEFLSGWSPTLDLREDKENLVATVELPGLRKEDIDVSVHESVLSVSGERTRDAKSQGGDSYRSERVFGRFHRTISLPKPVKAEGIKATYKEGVLTVTMPKTEEAKPKQIEVTMG